MRAVGECVWTHYLKATEKAGQVQATNLSTAWQEEVWLQYSSLQVALQVRKHIKATEFGVKHFRSILSHVFLFPQAYHQSLNQNPADTSVSGLHHTQLFFRSFSQVILLAFPHPNYQHNSVVGMHG